ncbi:Na(+)-translocating NADH-quinone reductase subunit C [Motiliproteus sp. MSK22-1]|uniref:Na(+)-translocating NADH-quinone reductase subunit C n=1 Tax=Motiliproteus sp. MSK22-1 TaxID=1897630 RepID=UPI000978B4F1|nr:Na(+)-translocating NADH-quinone reductase subunit C [Motiliproteus sp. MSK22-1]OMH33705.1 Na(+)-translocating NADH-quinone reductase subunit C [Motiliproteus sp. MSK22-1]
MSANNDTISKTLKVSVALCVVCAVFVSAAAVALKPQQLANKALDRKTNILAAADLNDPNKTVDELFDANVTAKVLDMTTGTWAEGIDPLTYDEQKAAKDPAQAVVLGDKDIAGIKQHARYKVVYMVKSGDEIEKLILPVHGKGLWSTLYGFMALEGDFNTVVGLGFYSHAETPGLGGEVDNPSWKAVWKGKKVYGDDFENAEIGLIKGKVDPAGKNAAHQIDGLAGATLTSNGVTNLVKFWLGENGYAPFLAKLRAGEV